MVDWVESTLLVEQGVYRGVEHLDEFGKVGLVLHVEMTVADQEVQGDRNTGDLKLLKFKQRFSTCRTNIGIF